MGYEHAPDAQNTHDCQLSSGIHPQIPDQEHRQQSNGKIRKRCSGSIQICNTKKYVGINTPPLLGASIPEMIDGIALEDGEEEEHEPDYNRQGHGCIEDNDVDALNRNA